MQGSASAANLSSDDTEPGRALPRQHTSAGVLTAHTFSLWPESAGERAKPSSKGLLLLQVQLCLRLPWSFVFG